MERMEKMGVVEVVRECLMKIFGFVRVRGHFLQDEDTRKTDLSQRVNYYI